MTSPLKLGPASRDLAKFKNKISILISLNFFIRIKSKELPTYASTRSEGTLDFSKRGRGGVWVSHDVIPKVLNLFTFSC